MSKKPSPRFDDTRQYKDDRDSKKEVKEYCSTCGEVHGSKCPEYYITHNVEPKPECDHVIKILAGGSEFCDLSRIHISGKETDCDESGYQETVVYYPVCCPECGEKLTTPNE